MPRGAHTRKLSNFRHFRFVGREKNLRKTVKIRPASSKRVLHAGQWRDLGESRGKQTKERTI